MSNNYSHDELKLKNVTDLRVIAKNLSIKGYSKMKKETLIESILNQEEARVPGQSKVTIRKSPTKAKSVRPIKPATQRSKKTSGTGNCPVNASVLGTLLADVNEISFCLTIGEHILTKYPLQENERDSLESEMKEIKQVIQERLDMLKNCLDVDYWKATTKEKQGIDLALYCITNNIFQLQDATGIFWSNTKSKFEEKLAEHTGTRVEWNGNPSDVVVTYRQGTQVKILGVVRDGNNSWFGISLKSSFTKGDIGQYNGSVSKFIEGVLFGTDNQILDDRVKNKRSPSLIMQNHIHNILQTEFYNYWSPKFNMGPVYQDNKQFKDRFKDAWKSVSKDEGDKSKGYLFNRCTTYILQQLESRFTQERRTCKLYQYTSGSTDGDPYESTPAKNQLSVLLDSLTYKRMIAAYLRKNHSEIDSYTYAKASMLDTTKVVELPKIAPYYAEVSAGVCQVYLTQTTNTTINISCEGARKSFDMRIKFGGSVPSSFKIDGSNNPKVISVNAMRGGATGIYRAITSLFSRNPTSVEPELKVEVGLGTQNRNLQDIENINNIALIKEYVDDYLQDIINNIKDNDYYQEAQGVPKILTTNDIVEYYNDINEHDDINEHELAIKINNYIEKYNKVRIIATKSITTKIKEIINTRINELIEGQYVNELMDIEGNPIYEEVDLIGDSVTIPSLNIDDGELVARTDEEINAEKRKIIRLKSGLCCRLMGLMCSRGGGNIKTKRKTKMRKKNKKKRRTRKKSKTRKKNYTR